MAMRRLLSLLRQSQAYCTDNVCLEELPGGLPSTQGGPTNFFLMTVCWIAIALFLYILRPGSVRRADDSKPHGNGFGSQGSPPTPPPAIN